MFCMLKKEKNCQLIRIALPEYSNLSKKEPEKLSKYKDPEVEVSLMWTVRTNTVPVIIEALETI